MTDDQLRTWIKQNADEARAAMFAFERAAQNKFWLHSTAMQKAQRAMKDLANAAMEIQRP